MIDGQPINNALTGGIDIAGISMESVERVEVVRGPYSASYGGNAMGGVINFITAGPDTPVTELRLGAGGMGQLGASLVHRKRYEGGLGVTLSLGYRQSDGYPDSDYVVKAASAGAGVPVAGAVATETTAGAPAWWVGTKGGRPWTQQGLNLAFHHSPTERTRLVAGVSWNEYSIGYRGPNSFLRDAAGNPIFSGAVSPAAGQRVSLAQTDFLTVSPSGEQDLRIFLRAEHRFDGGSTLRANLGTQRHDFVFAMGTSGSATYDGGPGELTTQPNSRTDFDVSLRTPMSDRWALTAGVAFNRSSLDRRTFALANWRDVDERGGLRTAGRGTSNNAAAFFQSEHLLGAGVTAYVGGRYDRFETRGQVIQTFAPAFEQAVESRSFSEFSPKLALVWEATPWLSLRGSYGEGFRPPALFDLYSRSTFPTATAGVIRVVEASPDLKPERIRSLEFGADLALAGQGRASVTVYRQRLADLIYRRTLSPTLSRTENAGEADVDGIEASLRWKTPVRGLSAFGSVTHQFRYDIARNDAVPDSVGKRLTDVPQTMWAAGLEFDGGPWSAWVAYRHVSRVFASSDDLNVNTAQGVYGAYDAHGVVSAKVGYRLTPQLSGSLAVDNLTDERYFVFSRQPGRTFYGELAYRF
jgi:iron complex outermembrane receptor protein